MTLKVQGTFCTFCISVLLFTKYKEVHVGGEEGHTVSPHIKNESYSICLMLVWRVYAES